MGEKIRFSNYVGLTEVMNMDWEEPAAIDNQMSMVTSSATNNIVAKRKLINKYDYDVQVRNMALSDMIYVKKERAQVILPHTAGKYAKRQFGKMEMPIIERFVVALMVKAKNQGKKEKAIGIVLKSLEIIALLTGEKPIQVVVDAVQNAAMREDKSRVGKSTMAKPASVDVSSYRALNKAIYFICAGAYKATRKNTKSISELLADELINASKNNPNSYAIKKKDECERTALAS